METFEFVTKKRKRRNRLITVALAVIAVFGLYIGARVLSTKLISHQAWKVVDEVALEESIAYPNIDTYTWSADGGDLFHGGIKGKQAKDVYGIPVDYADYGFKFDLFGRRWGDGFETGTGQSTKFGSNIKVDRNLKIAQFYNTKAKAKKSEHINQPTKELPYIKEMKNQLVEVAITFDKPYSLKEIRTMIPKGLKTNWYWIGTNTTGDPSWWAMDSLYGTSPEMLTRKEYVHKKEAEEARDKLKDGEKLDDRLAEMKDVDGFLTNLKKYMEMDSGSSYNGINPADDIKAYLEKFGKLDLSKKEDLEKLEFAGLILTGKSEDFAQLENQSWIYASSIGVSIPNQPYYQHKAE